MFRPIPEVPYHRFKSYLYRHAWTHYLFHLTYCWFKDNINRKYIYYTPGEWVEYHGNLRKRYVQPPLLEDRLADISPDISSDTWPEISPDLDNVDTIDIITITIP